MIVRPKRISKTVVILTDPTPQLVSLVGAGANKMPFNSIKSAVLDSEPVAELTAKANDPTAFTRFSFAKAEFPDTAGVEAWLTSGGYEGYEITETEAGFDVLNEGVTVKGDASPTEISPGVTAYVGLVDEAVAGVTAEVKAAKSEVVMTAKEAGAALVATKSISSLGDLSCAIRQLMWIIDDKEWETEWSGKESAGLMALRNLGPALIEAFRTLAVEEVNAFGAYITAATTPETPADIAADVAAAIEDLELVVVTESAEIVPPVAEIVADAPVVEAAKDDIVAADLTDGGLIAPEVLNPVVPVVIAPEWAAPMAQMADAIAAMAATVSTLSEGIAASKAASDEAVAKAEKTAEVALKSAADAEAAASAPSPRSAGIEETTPAKTGVSVSKAVKVEYDPELLKAFDSVLPPRRR